MAQINRPNSRFGKPLMNPHRFGWTLLAIAAALAPVASIAITLPLEGLIVYDENPSNGSKKGFYLFDPVTTNLTLISEVTSPSDRFSGFDWSVAEQKVYSGSEQGRLYSFDLLTGQATLIGQVLPPPGPRNFIRGVAVHPTDGYLYGMGFGPTLYRIDPTNANATSIGPAASLDGGMTFDRDGRLLGWSDRRAVIEIDVVTAVTERVSPEQTTYPMSNWTYAPDGFLYGVNYTNGSIVRTDPNTGAWTVIRAYPQHQSGLFGIFYYSAVPEPNALALAVMLVGCGMMRRRRIA